MLALILFIVLLRFTPAGVTQYLPDRFSTWQGRLERFFDGHESDTDENGVYKITDDNYQVSHAKIAIARGGVFGQLPGHGQQRDFLPQAYFDLGYHRRSTTTADQRHRLTGYRYQVDGHRHIGKRLHDDQQAAPEHQVFGKGFLALSRNHPDSHQ